MKRLCVSFCLLSATLAYGQAAYTPYATLAEPPTILQPGGSTSEGDTWFHAWGSLPNADSTQPATRVYVDYMTTNDGTAWNNYCYGSIVFSYMDIDTSNSPSSLTNPTVQNCMSDFVNNKTNWTDVSGDQPWVWHSRGITSISGTLYMAVMRQYDSAYYSEYGVSLMMSTNGGRSWCYDNVSDCASLSNNGMPPQAGEGEFCATFPCTFTYYPASDCNISGDPYYEMHTYYDNCSNIANFYFVQYEKDGATDMTVDDQEDYIYAMASPSYGTTNSYNYATGNYLLRVSRSDNLQVGTNWQYYTGVIGGSVTDSGNWTGFGTSGSNKPAECSGSGDPTCGATNIFNQYSGSDFGTVYIDSTIGYATTTGFGPTVVATSTSLTGNSSDYYSWVPQIYWPAGLTPSGFPGGPNPFDEDFQTLVLATKSTSYPCDSSDPCLSLSGSGNYSLGTSYYAMYTQTLTFHDDGDGGNNWSCNVATSEPTSNEQMRYLFDGGTWWNGSNPGAQGPNGTLYNYANTDYYSMPNDLGYSESATENVGGLGFPDASSSDVFNTTYSDPQGDFTLIIAFNRSEDDTYNTAGNYERIADKETSAYGGDGGFTIQRNGATANQWCVGLQDAIYDCNPHTGNSYSTGDFPDGMTNLMGIRQCTTNGGCDSAMGTTLRVWNSQTSPSSPLISDDESALSTPADSTTFLLGNAVGGGYPFTGTILGFIYYNAALSDSDAQQASTALEDYLYCGDRSITFPGVTGNH